MPASRHCLCRRRLLPGRWRKQRPQPWKLKSLIRLQPWRNKTDGSTLTWCLRTGSCRLARPKQRRFCAASSCQPKPAPDFMTRTVGSYWTAINSPRPVRLWRLNCHRSVVRRNKAGPRKPWLGCGHWHQGQTMNAIWRPAVRMAVSMMR